MIVEPAAGDRDRGQPQPGRPGVLRLLDAAVHAVLARPGRRARARHPGRPGADPGRHDQRGLHPVPAWWRRLRSTRCWRSASDRRGELPRDERVGVRAGPARRPGGVAVARRRPARLDEATGTGATTVVLMPAWSIVHSRMWKAQVAYLARHYPGGHLRRPRQRPLRTGPAAAAAYTDEAVRRRHGRRAWTPPGVDRAVLVGLSCGASWAVQRRRGAPRPGARDRRDRRRLRVRRSPSRARPVRRSQPLETRPRAGRSTTSTTGSTAATADFVGFFFARCSPSRTRRSRSRTASAGRSTIDAGGAGRHDGRPARLRRRRSHAGASRCARGSAARCWRSTATDDQVRTYAIGERLAELTGGELSLVEGAGHGLPAPRPGAGQPGDPRRSSSGSRRAAAARRWTRAAARRPKRALYLSSPIGLGHARRDLAIADELRRLHPDLQVDWLAQDPVTRVLADRRETRAPGVARTWPASRRTSRTRPASTTCTRSRRSGGWTRSSSTTSWSSTTSSTHERLRPGDRRRGLGRRLLPAREPRAEVAPRTPG